MKVFAPITGYQVQLELVPDEVFSRRLVGDGISIDPTEGLLKSPVEGIVDFLHPSHHALTIKTAMGAEILIHIGLETVQLKGEGFHPLVKKGDRVSVGQSLIEFDLDFVATSAKSLLTQMLVSNGESFSIEIDKKSNLLVAGKDSVFTVLSNASPANESIQRFPASSAPPATLSEDILCLNPSGLHARPAAVLAGEAKKYSGEIQLVKGTRTANAKSVVSIMSLEVAFGELIKVSATGPDAELALRHLSTLIKDGLGEAIKPQHSVEAKSLQTPQRQTTASSDSPDEYFGVSASPGLVVGVIRQFKEIELEFSQSSPTNPSKEENKLLEAISLSKTSLSTLIEKLKSNVETEKASIFSAHVEILEDPELLDSSLALIQQGQTAAQAWQASYKSLAHQLAQLNNQVLAARSHDLLDVGMRVLRLLANRNAGTPASQNQNSTCPHSEIILARILTPSDLMDLDNKNVCAICTTEGGPSSHVSILARSMNLPSATSFSNRLLEVPDGTLAVLDTSKGLLKLRPSAEEVTAIQSQQAKMSAVLEENLLSSSQPAVTTDQHHIEVFANVGKSSEARKSLTYGAEGVGLVRSEFLFLERSTAPSEDEQIAAYQSIVTEMKNAPVIIRTLDVGGDKPLSYLPMEEEENPFLGIRGLRLSLRSQVLFRCQLRALIRVNARQPIRIMFPMVTSLDELMQAKQILLEEAEALGGLKLPSVGIMIEVPSAALLAEALAPHVDFFSIGSNDLTQYTLAIDRGHPQLAREADGLHPGVLHLIKATADAAKKFNKQVGVCGGMAGDPDAVPILIGLGVGELSVSVPAIPAIKAQIRSLAHSECVNLALRALTSSSAKEVRSLVKKNQGSH